MTQSVLLANRLREVILSGYWIANTNYKDQLENLNWEIAVLKLDHMNSISLLAQHIHYYIAGLKNVFLGGTLDIKDKFSFDFPPIKSQEQWDLFIQTFWSHTEQLALLMEQFPPDRLNQSFVDPKYGSYLRNIEGLIEHAYYHLGQIVLLKKQLASNIPAN